MTDTTKQEVLENQYAFYENAINELDAAVETIEIAVTPISAFLVADQSVVDTLVDESAHALKTLAFHLEKSKENIRKRLDAETDTEQEFSV